MYDLVLPLAEILAADPTPENLDKVLDEHLPGLDHLLADRARGRPHGRGLLEGHPARGVTPHQAEEGQGPQKGPEEQALQSHFLSKKLLLDCH